VARVCAAGEPSRQGRTAKAYRAYPFFVMAEGGDLAQTRERNTQPEAVFSMRRFARSNAVAVAGSAVLAVTGALSVTSASHATGDGPAETASWEVVASGLDNPRQLSFGRRGALFVAEAGTGGARTCLEGPAGVTCFGRSGAVTRISQQGVQTRVLDGLPSMAEEDGTAALGPSDLVVGKKNRRFVLAVGLGNDPAVRDELPAAGADLASLLTGSFRAGTWRRLSDLGAFEAAENPDGRLPDTNPVAVIRDDGDFVVVDAGANALLEVDDDGDVEGVLAVFPRQRAGGTRVDAVPTSVVEGPDGAFYVSQLTGFPFVRGAAKIWRVEDDDREVYARGLTNVTDLAFDDDSSGPWSRSTQKTATMRRWSPVCSRRTGSQSARSTPTSPPARSAPVAVR
jgi:hypothetical protein